MNSGAGNARLIIIINISINNLNGKYRYVAILQIIGDKAYIIHSEEYLYSS